MSILLGFDALLPEILARDMIEYGNEESIDYIDALNEVGAKIIPNSFTHIPYTIGSYSSLLALDIDWYNNNLWGLLPHGARDDKGRATHANL